MQNQEPLALETSEPEPDIAIVRGELTDFGNWHPYAEEVALVAEVADTTLVTDRYKAELYAQAGIPFFWLVNLGERCIEVMSSVGEVTPGRRQYGQLAIYAREANIPIHIAGQLIAELRVVDLLP